MKNLIATLFVFFATTLASLAGNVSPAPVSPVVSGVSADQFTFVGDVSYAFEAEVFTGEFGVEFLVVENFFVTPTATFSYDGTDFAFDGVNVLGEYRVDRNWAVYGDLELNNDFKYQEFTLGVSMRF